MADYQIKADKDGFIVGENVVELQLSDMARLLAVMRQVKGDTGEILKHLKNISTMSVAIAAKPYSRSAKAAIQQEIPVNKSAVDAPGRTYKKQLPANDPQLAQADRSVKRQQAAKPGKVAETVVDEAAKPQQDPVTAKDESNRSKPAEQKTPERGANGRFLKRESSGESDSESTSVSSKFAEKIGESLSENLSGLASGAEEIDPALKASQEVAEIISPLASAAGGIGGAAIGAVKSVFGSKDSPGSTPVKSSRFASLFSRRAARNEEAAQKEQSGLLKDISTNIQKLVKGSGAGGGGGDGLLGSLIRGGGSLAGGLLAKAGGLLSMLGAGAAGLIGAKGLKGVLARKAPDAGGAKAPAAVDGPDRKSKMLEMARKLPLTKMLAPVAAALSGVSIYQAVKAPDNPALTPEQNRAERYKNVGGIAGSGVIGTAGFAGGMAAGASIGTLILPGVGTAIGGVIGGLAGGVVMSDIGDKIGQFIGVELSKIDWSGIYKTLSEKIGGIVDDIKAKSAALWAATTAKVSSAATTAKVVANDAIDYTKGAANKIMDFVGLGSLSAQFEGKSHTVAKDNNGSYAYGKYQFNAKAGGLEEFFKANPQYRAQFSGMQPGSPEFNKRWKEVAANDSGFEAAQDKAAKQQFFDPLAPLAKSSGFKMDNRGVQEALFSGAVNHSPAGNRAIYAAASKVPGFADMTPEQQIDAFYKARTEYVQRANIAGGQSVKDSLSQRYVNERIGALGLAGKTAVSDQPNSPLMPVKAGTNSVQVKVPYAPKASAVKVQPAGFGVMAPVEPLKQLNQASSGKETVVAIIDQPTGQDLSDRRIASLVTGGLSA